MEKYLFEVGMFILATIIGIVSYYFKKNGDHLEKNDTQLQAAIDAVKSDLSDYKLEAQKEFVSKDEFIRAVSQQDKKLDKIYDEVLKLSKGGED